MDDRSFDALAKALSAAPSRRGLLAALLGTLGPAGPAMAGNAAGGRDGGKAHGRNRGNGHGNGRNRKGQRKGRGGGGSGGDRPLRYGVACTGDGQCATGRCAGGFCGCASAADCPGDGAVCQDNGTCTTRCAGGTVDGRCPLPGCTGCTHLSGAEWVCRSAVCLPETVGCRAGSADCPFGSVCGEINDAACCGGPGVCFACFPLGDVCSA